MKRPLKIFCHEFHELPRIQFVVIRGIRGKKYRKGSGYRKALTSDRFQNLHFGYEGNK